MANVDIPLAGARKLTTKEELKFILLMPMESEVYSGCGVKVATFELNDAALKYGLSTHYPSNAT